jgi:putative zinc finger/helix-turn-helix YgiT family protein
MKNKGVTEQVVQFCPFCKKEHMVERYSKKASLEIKGNMVEYIEDGFACPSTGSTWASAKMSDTNLLRARDAYRAKHGLLTSSQIIGIRKKYDLNQKELSNLFGWGDITVTRYETKLIQDETYDSLLQMAMDDPSFALKELNKHKGYYSDRRFDEIKRNLGAAIKLDGNAAITRRIIQNKYIDYDVGCDANGYKLLDIDKVADVIAFFAAHVNNLFKVKLMKLLWYSDVSFFNRYDKSMTGLVYLHKRLGALPIAHNELICLPTVNVLEEELEESTSYNIIPLDAPVVPIFTLEEQEVLSKVALRFKDTTGKKISDYMHNEDAYKMTGENEVIPYSMAKNIMNF